MLAFAAIGSSMGSCCMEEDLSVTQHIIWIHEPAQRTGLLSEQPESLSDLSEPIYLCG